MNGSRFSDLSVSSRYAIDPSVLPASFSFRYRIERSLVFNKYGANHKPQWHKRSNYQPWITSNVASNTYTDIGPDWFANINAPFEMGS